MPKTKQGLTPKQEKFAQKYVELGNATEAYRIAYNKPDSPVSFVTPRASRLLAGGKVLARVKELQERIVEKHQVTVDFVMEGLKRNLVRAMQEEEVLDRQGNPTGMYVYQGAVANRALELLGKQIGMFVDRLRHEGEIGDKHVHLHLELRKLEEEGLSEEEILKRAAELYREKIKAR